MKKVVIAMVLAFSGLASASSIAAPSFIPVDFVCPIATGSGPNVLSRFGGYIAGYGTETINGSPALNSPYFQYDVISSNIPGKLTNYFNDSTDYDSTTGVVSCTYASTGPDDSFTATYRMTNGAGGQIVFSSPASISINQPLGLKK